MNLIIVGDVLNCIDDCVDEFDLVTSIQHQLNLLKSLLKSLLF